MDLSRIAVFWDKVIEFGTTAGAKLLLALLTYIVGRIIISKLLKMVDKIQAKDPAIDPTAKSYIRNIVKAALYVVLVVAIISELGVPMASVIAVIASAGVAVGLAMQGSLANLAGGIMLLIFRPFNVGDYIIAGADEGTVRTISLFYTVLVSIDNKVVSIPNGALMNATISNCSTEELRRVDLTFNIAGSEPIKKVQATIMGAIVDTEKAMANPAPEVEPLTPIPGGLTYTVRVWCKTEDYWDVYFDLMRNIPTALGDAKIPGPSQPIQVNS